MRRTRKMSIRYESVENLLTLIKDKKIKPSDVVKDIYDAIEETDPTIKSFLALDKEMQSKKRKNWMNYKQKIKWMANYLVFQWV